MENVKKLLLTILLSLAILCVPILGTAGVVMAEENADHQHEGIASTLTKCEPVDDEMHRCYYLCQCSGCDESWTVTCDEPHHYTLDEAEEWSEASSDQCTRTIRYTCEDCGYSKATVEKKNHSFKKNIYGWSKASSKQCERTIRYTCTDCGYSRTTVEKKNHSFDKYHVCTRCVYGISKEVVCVKNTRTYANSNQWIKLSIAKDGVICLSGKNSSGGDLDYSFYNSSKKLYKSYHGANLHFDEYIPVRKGTYYLKICSLGYNISKGYVKYTFTAVADKRNTSLKNAITLSKDKEVRGVIYADDSRNYGVSCRYYKIEIKEPQYVYVYYDRLLNSGADFIYQSCLGQVMDDGRIVYHAFKEIDGVQNRHTDYFRTKKKMKKGTYFIYIGKDDKWNSKSRNQFTGIPYSVRWN